jgi:hypothetical protein
LWGGDFNLCANTCLDRNNKYYGPDTPPKLAPAATSEESMTFNNKLVAESLEDIWRSFHADKREMTFRRMGKTTGGDKVLYQSRLDYFLVRGKVKTWTKDVRIVDLHVNGVDHSAVTITLNYSTVEQGTGKYCLNVSHLKDPYFVSNVVDCIRRYKRSNTCPRDDKLVGAWWDELKLTVVSYSKIISRFLARVDSNQKRQLEHSLASLEQPLLVDPTCESLLIKQNGVKAALESVNAKACQGAWVRSRIQEVDEGERSSKYFLTLEKIRSEGKLIREIVSEDGVSHTTTDTILEEARNFWGSLLHSPDLPNAYEKSCPRATKKVLDNFNPPQLPHEDLKRLKGSHSLALSRR